MRKQKKPVEKGNPDGQLRDAAEKTLARTPGASPEMKEKTPGGLVHELRVHRIELEMQNEELKKTQRALEESRDRYVGLYDFSPVGYFTFTRGGRIAEVNLTGAALLGGERQELLNRGFGHFVAPEDLELWEHHLVSVYNSEEKQSCDLALKREDGATFHARLDSIRLDLPTARLPDGQEQAGVSAEQAGVSGGTPVVHTAVTDITERKQAEEALHNEKRSFQNLSENAPLGMAVIDRDGTFKYVNPKFREIFGYDRDDVSNGKIWFRKAFPDPTYRHNVISAWINDSEAFREGEKRPRTFIVTCKDGTEKIINFIAIHLGTGEDLLTFEDITERKRAEEALQKNEEAAKQLSDENAIIAEIGRIIGSTLNIDEVYERFAEEVHKLIPFDRIAINIINSGDHTFNVAYVTGVEIEERRQGDVIPLAGSATQEAMLKRSGSIIQIADENEITARFPVYLPSFRAGLRSMMTIPLIFKDQVLGIFHLQSIKPNGYTERDLRIAERVGDQIIGAIANVQLFSERLRAEEALRESEARFQELFNEAPVGYHEVDAEGRIIRVNRTELEMLGYTAEEMLGQSVSKFIVEEKTPQQPVLTNLANIVPSTQGFERTYQRKDGTTIPVLIERRVIREANGKVKSIRSTIQDITERKRSEGEMAALQEQLRQAQKMEAIGRLAGGIAHDFNNLLTIIKGYSQLSLPEIKEGDPLKENIEEINRAAGRAADLTRQLLAFSRRQVLEMKVLDLNIVLQNLDKMLRRVIGEDIELVTLLANDLGRVKTDPGQIEQVVMNLSVNARDAMLNGGKLTIETANVFLDEEYARSHIDVVRGRYVMLSVSDTGVGMTAEGKERIFEPFFTTKEKGKGTGLGLSTVYGIVKQSGGNIYVYSEPGRGTTFKIYLTRVDESLEEAEEKVLGEEILRGDETILIVEDDEQVRKLAVRILGNQGYEVLEAPQGSDALLLCEAHKKPIHLMLTDVVMPGMDGHELARCLESIRPETKVIYMSGYTDEAIVHHGILEKGVNYIQKPFQVDALAGKVREVLDNKEG